MGIVGLVVIILMVTGAVLPAVENAQNTQITETNNTTQRYFVSSSALSVELGAADGEATINGVKVSQITTSDSAYAFTDKFALRSLKSSDTWSTWMIIGLFDTTETITKIEGATVSIVDGSATITRISNPSDTFTCEVSKVMYPSATGDYGLFYTSNSTPLYVDADSDLYRIKVGGTNAYVQAGKMDTLTAYFTYDNGTITTGETYTVPSAEHIEEYGSDYYKITESPGSFGAFVAPIKYHIVADNDSMLISLFGIIPLLLIIVAVLYAVRLMGASRN